MFHRGATYNHHPQIPPLHRLSYRVQMGDVGIGVIDLLKELHHFVVVVVLEQVTITRQETVNVESPLGLI